MSLFEKHKTILDNAIKAIHERKFYAQYPEHPKVYGEEAPKKALEWFNGILNNQFNDLLQDKAEQWISPEISPYTQKPLGIKYPLFHTDDLISNAEHAFLQWKKTSPADRAGILIECLEKIKNKFFEIAYATQHTTGQSFIMSFQASGPHANDRALEPIALGYQELTRFPENVLWEKPMGKFSIKLDKKFHAIPKGISLTIGCSTFPVWNTVPGIFASLITGNPVIVKPHSKVILPIAIIVAEIQKTFKENNFNPHIIQLAVNTADKPIGKVLAENPKVKMIDYTGGTEFGTYLETLSLKGKTVFTEKAGVNSVIIDSVNDLDAVMQNLAFSVCLYSGQMCTKPQNFFIPEKVKAGDLTLSYEEIVQKLKGSIHALVTNPKMGAGTLGAVHEGTLKRAKEISKAGGKIILENLPIANEEFKEARMCSPIILEVDIEKHQDAYEQELFGPIAVVIKTKDTAHSVKLAKAMTVKHGLITCAAYTTDEKTMQMIEEEMNSVFAPVSFNLTGFIWVNQHAAFSDFHVTGGNPAGNATFTDSLFVTRRFVWVGNRKLV